MPGDLVTDLPPVRGGGRGACFIPSRKPYYEYSYFRGRMLNAYVCLRFLMAKTIKWRSNISELATLCYHFEERGVVSRSKVHTGIPGTWYDMNYTQEQHKSGSNGLIAGMMRYTAPFALPPSKPQPNKCGPPLASKRPPCSGRSGRTCELESGAERGMLRAPRSRKTTRIPRLAVAWRLLELKCPGLNTTRHAKAASRGASVKQHD